MRLLIVGNGGREHALAWKLSQSARVEQIMVAPGNGGTATTPKCRNVEIGVTDFAALSALVQREAIDLTVVGPEVPLVGGIVDHFQQRGLRIFGPTAAAARLEGSKAFTKEFLLRHQIPTAAAAIFSDFDDAMRWLREQDDPPVVKASGLAAGKGVILPETMTGVATVIQDMLLNDRFGEAGATIVLEERLSGPELSVFAICDGKDALLIPTAQDHKRLLDGDHGPNTGGMGAFSPSPLATPELMARIETEIIRPTLAAAAAEGMPYQGVLYAGLMLTEDGPKVIEFNCRFGDPEAQAILPRLESDLLALIEGVVDGNLAAVTPQWSTDAAMTVVMASRGYPGEYESGVEITGIDDAEASGAVVFHAGTKWMDERLVTAGGRVLAVTALGPNLSMAAVNAYHGVQQIQFNGAHYRKDIAKSYRTVR
ncbi:MAG: phosphoribosylamine--glycine ligase [Caldilineaceae bacterium]|nr:phosphoribosylamine--glycine ligase [Caldilineaceae bacterium]